LRIFHFGVLSITLVLGKVDGPGLSTLTPEMRGTAFPLLSWRVSF